MLVQARFGLITGRGALDAAPAGGASVAITQVDHGEDTANAGTYTFTSRALGSAQADRRIIIGASSRIIGTTTTLSSVTVAGISASQVVSSPNTTGGNTTLTELWIADVPSGTTGNVVVTYSSGGTPQRCGINVWRMVGAASGTASATGMSTVDPGTATITIPSNGSAVGYAACDMTGGAINWTNLTQTLAATVVEASFQHGAASADFTTGGSTALTGDFTGTGVSSPSSCFATWSP